MTRGPLLYVPERLAKPKPPTTDWERPSTGSQFDHLPLPERIFATPLLLHRLRQYKIALPKLQPVYDRIVVYPLMQVGKETTGAEPKGEKMGNGLYAPEMTTDRMNAGRGLLVRAGMGALEQLWSHGIEIGHIVLTARLSPWEREYQTKEGYFKTVMLLRASEVVGSEDLEEDIAGDCIEFDMDGPSLGIKERKRTDPPENDEGI